LIVGAGRESSKPKSHSNVMKGFLVLLLLPLCSLTALAGPPFVTDDPEPVDYQHWEFYIASQHIETSDGWS